MKIGILTYNVKHRKTYDILTLLKANGYNDVVVYGIPMHYIKKKFPLIEHRPELNINIPNPEILCINFGYEYKTGKIKDLNIEKDSVLLIGGAGILPDNFVKKHIIINSHPGFIPLSRGLDSFKWAIIDMMPIGVTTHLIGDYVDAGEVIERREIPVYINDTFYSLAMRVYENEISMLIEALNKYKKTTLILPKETEVHKRMPPEIEITLLERFDIYKQKYGKERKR